MEEQQEERQRWVLGSHLCDCLLGTRACGLLYPTLVSTGLVNPGIFYYADGNIYDGEFKDDIKHGKGKLVISPGQPDCHEGGAGF